MFQFDVMVSLMQNTIIFFIFIQVFGEADCVMTAHFDAQRKEMDEIERKTKYKKKKKNTMS